MVRHGIRGITDHDDICTLAQAFRDGLTISLFAGRKLEQRNVESNTGRIGSRAHRRTLNSLPGDAQGEIGQLRSIRGYLSPHRAPLAMNGRAGVDADALV